MKILQTEIDREFELVIENCLRRVLSETHSLVKPPEIEEADLCDIDEAAKILGYKISTIYSKTSKNALPYIKQGKLLRFSKSDLKAWINSGKRATKQEEIEKFVAKSDQYLVDKRNLKLKIGQKNG